MAAAPPAAGFARRVSAYPLVDMDAAWAALRDATRLIMLADAADGGGAQHWVDTFRAAALGRVLSAPVLAPRAVPAAPCSRLDGFALRAPPAPAGAVYRVAARQRAGASAAVELPPGAAVAWVTTGGALPLGADAVVGVEATTAVDAAGRPLPGVARGSEEFVQLAATAAAAPGDNVRAAGSDVPAGAVLLHAGHQLTPPDLAALLSAGVTRVPVRAPVCVGILGTGDELVSPEAAAAGDGAAGAPSPSPAVATNVVVDSNSLMLELLLGALGSAVAASRLGIAPDTLDAVTGALRSACAAPNAPRVLVLTGGVSMGDRDYVKPALEALCSELGGRSRVLFGRLSMKPGKPTTAALLDVPGGGGGEHGGAAAPVTPLPGARRRLVLVLALPGNPVSALVGGHMLVAPAVRALSGLPWAAALPATARVTMLDGVACDPERPEFHRVVAWAAAPPPPAGGGLMGAQPPAAPHAAPPAGAIIYARSTGSQASSRLLSAVGCNALLWVPASSAGDLQPPFTGVAHLLGPLAAPAALPAELADVARLRTAAQSGASAGGAGGGGCMCGGGHDDAAAAAGAPPLPAALPSSAAAAAGGAYPPHLTAPATALDVRIGVLTISTRCARGETLDLAGPAVVAWFSAACGGAPGSKLRAVWPAGAQRIVADDAAAIRAAAQQLLGEGGPEEAGCSPPPAVQQPQRQRRVVDVLVTSGGTGMAPSDVTPEALRPLIARPAPGLQHAMLAASLRATPMAALSRYEAGVSASGALLLQLPGSPKAVRECLDAVRLVLPHALAQLCEQ
jgi:molybdenum cofactor synthesis domain-containing protein